jgi:hypothetical protein
MTSPTREPRKVIADTTPIIALALIDQLDLLRRLYTEILIPPAVEREILAGGETSPGTEGFLSSTWFEVRALQDPSRRKLLAGLDPQPLLMELVQGGIHLGDEVVREALKLAREA